MSSVSDLQHNIEIKRGSDRGFGMVFAAVFFILALWPYLNGGTVRPVFLAIGGAFLAVAVAIPAILHVPNKLWFKFGLLLGAVMAPVAMAIIYLVVFVPFSLMFRLTGKDPLRIHLDRDARSYWIAREQEPQSMTRQF